MNRLLAFGCSYTYGTALKDCWHPKYKSGPEPSKLAWPSVLAESLGRECVNLSMPGASNKFIWYKIMNTEYKENDIIVVCWSHSNRHAVLHKDYPTTNTKKYILTVDDLITDMIGPWTDTVQAKMYYTHLHSDIDDQYMNSLYIDHAYRRLDKMGIRHYHYCCSEKYIDICDFSEAKLNLPSIANITNNNDKGLDNAHPGPRSHKIFAKQVYRKIRKG